MYLQPILFLINYRTLLFLIIFYHTFVPYLFRNLFEDEVELMSTYEYLWVLK